MMKLKIFYAFISFCGALCAASDVSNSSDTTTLAPTTVVTSGSVTNHTAAPILVTTTEAATTVHPTAAPCPLGRWSVKYDVTGKDYCIIMQADIVVKVTKNKTDEYISINQSSPNRGDCKRGEKLASMTIMDNSGLLMEWTFVQDEEAKNFNVTSVEITYLNVSVTLDKLNDWMDKIDSSGVFQCNANETFQNQSSANMTMTFTVSMRSLKLLAFRNNTSTCDFTNLPYNSCAADTNVSNLVPIIVGACLGGLIVIVLIAYLVGRRRSRRGYESV